MGRAAEHTRGHCPLLITYTPLPSIATVMPCNSYELYRQSSLNCAPRSTLTIRGMRFPPDTSTSALLTPSLQLTPLWQPLPHPVNASCEAVRWINSTTLECRIPSHLTKLVASTLYSVQSYLQLRPRAPACPAPNY